MDATSRNARMTTPAPSPSPLPPRTPPPWLLPWPLLLPLLLPLPLMLPLLLPLPLLPPLPLARPPAGSCSATSCQASAVTAPTSSRLPRKAFGAKVVMGRRQH
jgi:hypothetical protein